VPDAWAMAADVVREELARRERERAADPVYGLSRDAIVLLHVLSECGGSISRSRPADPELDERVAAGVLDQFGIDVPAALDEVIARGLVRVTWSLAEGVWPPAMVAILRYEGPLPPVPEE
jgi:hypothetical protein